MNKWTRIRFQPNRPLGENNTYVTACFEHVALSKNAAKEGMVLLKNDRNVLPFPVGTKLALFGKGTFDYVKGGGGSGDVTVEYTVNLYEGLKLLDKHVQVYEKLADYYRCYVHAQYADGKEPGMLSEPELPDDLCEGARSYTDTAVISVSRFSGEEWDRSQKGNALFEHGDFYLSDAERAMVEKVKKSFPKVVVVLNVGGIVDTSWFADDENIQAVLMAWQGGMEGGSAAAELLCGIGNPSGKLPDTFARCLEDYPSTEGFHESDDYVDYTEDVYVGYRYFETLPGAKDKVVYPFGFGLSYTEFKWKTLSVIEQEGRITVEVMVSNIGKREGREVIQLYVCPPQGLLGKPLKNLIAFQKTRNLKPGENQILSLHCDLSNMASYDDLGKVAKSAWVLEKGQYIFYLGTSVRNVSKLSYIYEAKENVVLEQLSAKLTPTSLKHRLLADGSYEELPLIQPNDPNAVDLPPELLGEEAYLSFDEQQINAEKLNFDDVAEGKISLDTFVSKLSDRHLVHLLGGQPNLGVADTFGFGNIPQLNIPNAMTADGPAGLRIKKDRGICSTAFPCATLVAASWDAELSYCIGVAGAREVKENNLAVWLTPAVNIHRSPLCGRNFEYYSEDPLLAGILAGAMVRGIQSENISAAVKHFALNNKETNRRNSDSRVSERAAREIYLKPFEIVVKEASPWYIMSSYNIINGHRASENRELLEDILREEWGFDGMVSTDWWTYGKHYKEVKAGNDLKMHIGWPEQLMNALNNGLLTREDVERSAKRVLQLLLRIGDQ